MQKYKQGDLCVIDSKTSHNNGKLVEVIGYTKGKYEDILQVQSRKCKFFIKESSLVTASKYDVIRNMKDKQLRKLLRSR
jgi:hypothetical protein